MTLKKSGLVAAYGDEASDSGEEETVQQQQPPATAAAAKLNEDDLIDLSKMACLLCKRQFANREALNR